MLGRWRKLAKLFTVMMGTAGLLCLAVVSSLHESKFDSISEINSDENLSSNLSPAGMYTARLSRLSAVSVMSMSIEGGYVSSSSGTYIRYRGKYYILTVSHGIGTQDCDFIRIVVDEEMHNCNSIAAYNEIVDYAIIEVEPIESRTPVNIPRSIPDNNRWAENLSVLTEITHTGFPSGMGPLTMNGKIAGYTENENLYVHSFAWPGSSGSGVFNENGKLIGFIMAINLGYTDFGITVLEDVVIVVPLYKINWNNFEN